MHNEPTSAHGPARNCVFCDRSVASGAAVWRARHPYHVDCLVRFLAPPDIGRSCPTLWDGLLPAGKDRNARRSNLNNANRATTEVGGHA